MQAHNAATAAAQMVELSRAPCHITCALGSIVVVYSSQPPAAEYLERSARVVNDWGAKYPGGLGLMVLIAADEPPPDEPTRRAIHSSYVTMQRSLRGCVLVVEGEGFIASAKRSVITVLNLSNSLAFPIKVASTVPEGATKLAKMLGPLISASVDPERVAWAVAQIRQRVRNELQP